MAILVKTLLSNSYVNALKEIEEIIVFINVTNPNSPNDYFLNILRTPLDTQVWPSCDGKTPDFGQDIAPYLQVQAETSKQS